MNDIAELKQYVEVHARGQRVKGYRRLLDRIHNDEGDTPGSWVGEWCEAGRLLEARGRLLEASRHYAMARFPYVNGPARREALERCVRAVDRWRQGTGIEPLDVDLGTGRVRCWSMGLSATDRKPLVLLMGGIVTIKEQWAPTLVRLNRVGLAGLVTEMPSTGENTLRYTAESWTMLPGLLDAVADRADVSRVYAIAMSFSGHLAIRAAVSDHRIRAVITTGAPISEFFTDSTWRQRLPRVTVNTLAYMSAKTPACVAGCLDEFALREAELAALDIPISYAASRRDEIIPWGEVQLLEKHIRDLDLIDYDDVHGSPRHVAETQLWSVAALLRAHGVGGPQRHVIEALLRGYRLRRRFMGRTTRTEAP